LKNASSGIFRSTSPILFRERLATRSESVSMIYRELIEYVFSWEVN